MGIRNMEYGTSEKKDVTAAGAIESFEQLIESARNNPAAVREGYGLTRSIIQEALRHGYEPVTGDIQPLIQRHYNLLQDPENPTTQRMDTDPSFAVGALAATFEIQRQRNEGVIT